MKKYTFHSPKTAGNTIVCLNMAIAYQCANPQSRVGLLSCARYSDLPQYLNLAAPKQTLHQLLHFIGTDEWSPDLVDAIAQFQVVSCLPGPRGQEWADITAEHWKSIMDLLVQKYDVLFVDLGRDIPVGIQNEILKQSDTIITTSCLDPVGLNALNQFLDEHQVHKDKQFLLINQAPKEAKAFIAKNLKAHAKMVLGCLPLETKHMWDQVYKGVPLVLQKKSKWKKALSQSLEMLQKL